jgi:hypothetical protein
MLADYLIQLQDINALQYYYNYIKNEKHIPLFLTYSDSLGKLNNIKAIPLLFKMYELGYNPDFKIDKFNDIKSYALGAIQVISLYENNFNMSFKRYQLYKFNFKLGKSLKLNKKDNSIIQYLDTHYENIEHKYYINRSMETNASEALLEYKALA